MQIHTRLAGAILRQALSEARREKEAHLAEADRLLAKVDECDWAMTQFIAPFMRRIETLLGRLEDYGQRATLNRYAAEGLEFVEDRVRSQLLIWRINGRCAARSDR